MTSSTERAFGDRIGACAGVLGRSPIQPLMGRSSRRAPFASVLLFALVAIGSARAGPAREPASEPSPLPSLAPVPAPISGSGLVLVSRVGAAFATAILQFPLEEPGAFSRLTEPEEARLPVAFALGRVTPNPVLGRARIGFDLPVASRVSCDVLDVAGRVVRSVAVAAMPPGRHTLEWSVTDAGGPALSPGVYFLRMEARAVQGTGGFRRVEKILVLR